jgi:hypothetical protein
MEKKSKKLVFYANFPITPTPGYLAFFNRIFSEINLTLVDVNNPKSADIAISFNHTEENFNKIVSAGIDKENRFLIMYECAQILPDMHKDSTLAEYGHIYAPSPFWATNFKTVKFNYPFHLNFNHQELQNNIRQVKIGIIQRNLLSCIKGENYTLRRRIIKARKNKIVVAGEGWGANKFVQYFRYIKLCRYYARKVRLSKLILFPKSLISEKKFLPVSDKQEFLSKVEFAIIIENHEDYVSEKIFDCFRAGTVPIYYGPNLEDFGIPENTVIKVNDLVELKNVVDRIDEYNSKLYRQNAFDFLKHGAQAWDEKKVMVDLAEKIINEIK